MELIDQYLKSVRALLPKAERDDIIAELSANLAAQVEEEEAELGRPLGEADERAILARLGSPLQVAERYTAGQGRLAFGREWVGPALFPFYVKVLVLNTTLVIAACVAISVALHGLAGLQAAVGAVAFQVLLQFAIVTGIFVLAGRYRSRLAGGAATETEQAAGVHRGGHGGRGERVSRLESFAELVALAGLFAWAYSSRAYFAALLSPGDGLYLASACRDAFFALLGIAVAWTVQAAVSLVRPDWAGFRFVVRMATSVAWLGLLVFLVARAPLVLVGSAIDASRAARAAGAINRSITYSLVAVAVVSAGVLVRDLVLVARRARAGDSVL